MSAREVSEALAETAEAVCRHYLPTGFRAGSFWRSGDVFGTKGKSLVVTLRGKHRGRWIDNATGEKGDLLDLIRATTNCATMREAMEEAERFLGHSFLHKPGSAFKSGLITSTVQHQLKVSDPRQLNEADEAARLRKAKNILSPTVPIWGTPGERYIVETRHGSIHPECTELRFHPNLWHGWTQTRHPAVIGIITDFLDAEKFRGVVAIYLNADGTGKAGIEPAKPTWGLPRGGVVRLTPDHEIATRINLAEGIETGSTLIRHGWQVWAALTAGNLGSLPVLPGTPDLGVFADHDASGTGQREANNLAHRWSAAGGWAEIFTPPEPGMDWNSVEARQ